MARDEEKSWSEDSGQEKRGRNRAVDENEIASARALKSCVKIVLDGSPKNKTNHRSYHWVPESLQRKAQHAGQYTRTQVENRATKCYQGDRDQNQN